MNILITGGSGGIGSAAAELFVKKGHHVAYTYLTSKPSAPGLAVRCDVRDYAQVENFVRLAREEYGEADAAICCAGVAFEGLFTHTPYEQFRRVMDTNFEGTYNLCKAVTPELLSKKSGSITTVASIWGMVGGSCESIYSASKGAVIAFTKAIAKELAPSGIRVNCLAPGAIDTAMTRAIPPADMQAFINETPMERMGTVEEMADWLYFITCVDTFSTGQVFSPNGGAVI